MREWDRGSRSGRVGVSAHASRSTASSTSSGPTGVQGQNEAAAPLPLTNLTTGASRQLRWPSTLRFGYELFPDPGSSMVAVEFADPAYRMTSLQAGDVWLLNTRNGTSSQIPDFPVFEYLKVSGMAWTTDHRLIIVAYGRGRPSIGIWRPRTATGFKSERFPS